MQRLVTRFQEWNPTEFLVTFSSGVTSYWRDPPGVVAGGILLYCRTEYILQKLYWQ
jgi:hypothetical protein